MLPALSVVRLVKAVLPPTAPPNVLVPAVLTVRLKVVWVLAPSLSVAVMVTVPLLSGPSVVAYDQLQVPGLVLDWVTAPTEAVMVTVSLPGSEKVPVLAAVWPSLTASSVSTAALQMR